MAGQVYAPSGQSACLWPVTEENVSEWRRIYNRRMVGVDNAQTLTRADERKILDSCGAYFVHSDGELLGIGWVEGNMLLAVASVKRGAGEAVTRALVSLVPDETAELEVASTNVRAIRLYERLGFVKTGELSVWYKIF
jgi:RimJ/RimL family protein N-acetyltransferase